MRDLANKRKQWSYDSKISVYSKPGVDGDTLFFGTNNEIVAINKNNGHFIWRYDLPSEDEFALDNGGVSYSAAVVDENNVFIGTDKGNLYALNKANGEESWIFSTDDGMVFHASALQRKKKPPAATAAPDIRSRILPARHLWIRPIVIPIPCRQPGDTTKPRLQSMPL